MGAGPGQVTAELTTHFKHVVASDINTTHLAVAEHRLASLISSQQVILVPCPAEEIAKIHAQCSADLIAAAECFPLVDAKVAVDAFSQVLRPNGTLAIWFYGRPIFAESEYAGKCQPLLNSILDLQFAKIIKKCPPQQKTSWERATNRMASWLDDIKLDSDVWRDIERRKWSNQHPMPFYGSEACDFEIVRSTSIAEGERTVEIQDATFWERQWDLAGVKRFVSANLPYFDELEVDDRVEALYKDLERAMDGEDQVRKITWPVVCMLASKK